MKRLGRPTSMTEAVVQRLCAMIAEGYTVKQACAEVGMPAPSTIYLALANNPAFSERYARAREAQLARWEDELLEIADDGSNDWTEREGQDGSKVAVVDHEHITRSRLRADTRKWLMSKRMPQKYGDRIEIDGAVKHRYELRDTVPTVAEWEAEHCTEH